MAELEIVQFTVRSDNFCVLVHDPDSGTTVAIDAPAAEPMMATLAERGWRLSHIFVTHKHSDHIEGIPALKAAHGCRVVGPEKSAAAIGLYDDTVGDGDTLEWAGTTVRVLATPGHTLDHISYHLPDHNLGFVGDTMFAMGCGRVFEGTPPMMWASLLRLRGLADETELYCGHEYTLANARFAVTVDPDNRELAARLTETEELRKAGRATLPTTIAREKATNPFLRADHPALAAALGLKGRAPEEVFAEIRKRKDSFKG